MSASADGPVHRQNRIDGNLHHLSRISPGHYVALTRWLHTDMPTPIRAVAGVGLVVLQNTHRDRHPLSVLPPLREPRPTDELEAG